jgi:hypothetical protein
MVALEKGVRTIVLTPFSWSVQYWGVATQADVRRIALSLPETEEAEGRFAFSVRNKGKLKGFAWVWMERIQPKKPRVANPAVLAVRVGSVAERDAMVSADPAKFFTEPHYEGFPAVLVKLAAVNARDLRTLLTEGWRCQAPAELTKAKTRR